jgi:hypothetical protein
MDMKRMKTIFALALMTFTLNHVWAQDAIGRFFSKYQNDESFSQVTVSSKMFNLFTNMEAESPEDKEVLDAISKLKGLRILSKDDAANARTLYKEAFALIPKDYEELMSVRDKDRDMKFYIKESSGKISELIMIAGGTKTFTVVSLFGEVDLKQVSRIAKKMDVKGLESLEKIDGKPAPKAPTSKNP